MKPSHSDLIERKERRERRCLAISGVSFFLAAAALVSIIVILAVMGYGNLPTAICIVLLLAMMSFIIIGSAFLCEARR